MAVKIVFLAVVILLTVQQQALATIGTACTDANGCDTTLEECDTGTTHKCIGKACLDADCNNHGACTAGTAGTAGAAGKILPCICTDGYSGTKCETDPPASIACTDAVCMHGGSCKNGNEFPCHCTGGYTGDRCQTGTSTGTKGTDTGTCKKEDCKNFGTCPDSGNLPCTCVDKFTGDTCETAPACKDGDCKNDGKCTTDGKLPCTCKDGYTGNKCEKSAGNFVAAAPGLVFALLLAAIYV